MPKNPSRGGLVEREGPTGVRSIQIQTNESWRKDLWRLRLKRPDLGWVVATLRQGDRGATCRKDWKVARVVNGCRLVRQRRILRWRLSI